MKNKDIKNPHVYTFRMTWDEMLIYVICMAVGAVLVIIPELAQETAILALGAVSIVIGIAELVKYAMMENRAAINSDQLLKGLVWLTCGIFIIIRRVMLSALLSTLLGAYIIFCGLKKIQYAVNLYRMQVKIWYLEAISAGISMVFGILMIVAPFADGTSLMRFIGIGYLIEGLIDLIARFGYFRAYRKYFSFENASASNTAIGDSIVENTESKEAEKETEQQETAE